MHISNELRKLLWETGNYTQLVIFSVLDNFYFPSNGN
jgi:hypothetical protein